jgi:hypothetical protein
VSYTRTPEIREKNAAPLRGRPILPSTLAALIAANTGRKMPPEHKELLRILSTGRVPSEKQREISRLANLGKHPSEETRAKISAAGKRRKMSESTKAAVRLAHLGVPLTEEAKRHISESKRGKPLSEKARIAMLAVSAGNIGRKASPEECARRSLLFRGEKNPMWKGGVTPEVTRIRVSKEYGQWRTFVFVRDNYVCQKCGAHSEGGHAVTLAAHHMDCFADFPEKRLDVDNGITLCKECHHDFSLRYGMLHNRKWQTDEFLGGTGSD